MVIAGCFMKTSEIYDTWGTPICGKLDMAVFVKSLVGKPKVAGKWMDDRSILGRNEYTIVF